MKLGIEMYVSLIVLVVLAFVGISFITINIDVVNARDAQASYVAEIENSSSGYWPRRWFTIVLLPAPDGAEKIMTLLFINVDGIFFQISAKLIIFARIFR